MYSHMSTLIAEGFSPLSRILPWQSACNHVYVPERAELIVRQEVYCGAKFATLRARGRTEGRQSRVFHTCRQARVMNRINDVREVRA